MVAGHSITITADISEVAIDPVEGTATFVFTTRIEGEPAARRQHMTMPLQGEHVENARRLLGEQVGLSRSIEPAGQLDRCACGCLQMDHGVRSATTGLRPVENPTTCSACPCTSFAPTDPVPDVRADLCVCGHERGGHIYDDCACRTGGVVCPCRVFVAADVWPRALSPLFDATGLRAAVDPSLPTGHIALVHDDGTRQVIPLDMPEPTKTTWNPPIRRCSHDGCGLVEGHADPHAAWNGVARVTLTEGLQRAVERTRRDWEPLRRGIARLSPNAEVDLQRGRGDCPACAALGRTVALDICLSHDEAWRTAAVRAQDEA